MKNVDLAFSTGKGRPQAQCKLQIHPVSGSVADLAMYSGGVALLTGWVLLLLVSISYVALLLAVAWLGDRHW